MKYTTNYKLKKPLDIENYDIEIHNENFDIVDFTLKQLENRFEQYATKEELNTLLAIITQANTLLKAI